MTFITKILCPRRRSLPRAGFSVVELIIAVLIVGILAAVAIPRFADSLERSRVNAAATRIERDLNRSRQTAIASSADVTIQFSPNSESYAVPLLPSLDHPSQSYRVQLDTAPYDTLLVSAALGGDANLIYDRFGTPDTGGTITIQSGRHQRVITIQSDGGISSFSMMVP